MIHSMRSSSFVVVFPFKIDVSGLFEVADILATKLAVAEFFSLKI